MCQDRDHPRRDDQSGAGPRPIGHTRGGGARGGGNPFPTLTAEAAAELIPHGALVAFSGFTPAGAAKAVPRALAARARRLHQAGHPFAVRVLTGASTGPSLDDALAEADAVSWRAPYQSSAPLRRRINDGRVAFVDMHLSHVPQAVLSGFFGPVDVAVVEASEVTADGRVFLTSSVGASPTFLQVADKVLIELNRFHPRRASEMADILVPRRPPYRPALDLGHPLQRIGQSYARVDPGKVVGVVETCQPDELGGFDPPDPASRAIAGHVVRFLLEERAAGRIPPEFLPLQSGVGNVANAVLGGLGADPDVPDFLMYSEVFQAAAFELMRRGRLRGASTCALTLRPEQMVELAGGLEFFAPRLVLRPQEISNDPAVLRQLGVIALNTALEFDLCGHVNSTHVCGRMMMNGVGGSGDFARNAYLSIFMCPSSTAKGGKVSTVVPKQAGVEVDQRLLGGERLPFEDGTFAYLVSTFTLCSIEGVAQAVREVYRVLRPGGKFLFLEHGLSPEPGVRKWQRRLNWLQMRLAGGCHLDRDMRALVSAQPFASVQVDEFYMERTPRTHGSMYRGVATK
jgi:acyl-CoA hydrolase